MEGKAGIEDTKILPEITDIEAKGEKDRIGEENAFCNADSLLGNLVPFHYYENLLLYLSELKLELVHIQVIRTMHCLGWGIIKHG